MYKLALVSFLAVGLTACASDTSKLTSAKEDFNASVSRVIAYETGPRCSATVVDNCAPQATVDLLVEDVNGCNKTINDGEDASAVKSCTAKLNSDLSANKVP